MYVRNKSPEGTRSYPLLIGSEWIPDAYCRWPVLDSVLTRWETRPTLERSKGRSRGEQQHKRTSYDEREEGPQLRNNKAEWQENSGRRERRPTRFLLEGWEALAGWSRRRRAVAMAGRVGRGVKIRALRERLIKGCKLTSNDAACLAPLKLRRWAP